MGDPPLLAQFDDAKEFRDLEQALLDCGLGPDEIDAVWGLLAALLALGDARTAPLSSPDAEDGADPDAATGDAAGAAAGPCDKVGGAAAAPPSASATAARVGLLASLRLPASSCPASPSTPPAPPAPGHPPPQFRMDLTGGFGTCKCGFKKAAHSGGSKGGARSSIIGGASGERVKVRNRAVAWGRLGRARQGAP